MKLLINSYPSFAVRFLGALLVVFSITSAEAQLSVSFNTGLGTFQMKDIKAIQQTMVSNLGVDAQVTSSFPAYVNYELQVTNRISDNLRVGGIFSHGSTGGRVSYSDYSGNLRWDQLASYYSLMGSIGGNIINVNSKLHVGAELRPGILYTNLKFSNNEVIGNSSSIYTYRYHSINVVVQPTITATMDFGRWSINAYAGYNFNVIKGELQHGPNNLYSANSDKAHADWSGIRAGVGVAMKLRDNAETPKQNTLALAIGAGLDYGGFGVNVVAYPHQNVGVFVGAGYALAGLGTNGGLKLRANSKRRTMPYVLGMYGYNAAIAAGSRDKLFYGFSTGIGIDLKGHDGDARWSFAVLVPMRGKEAQQYIDNLKSQGVKFQNELLPVTISVGFRIFSVRE